MRHLHVVDPPLPYDPPFARNEAASHGKYELLERIGEGGMAEVFRARLPGAAGFEKIVVVKRMLPALAHKKQFVDMFIAEATLAAQVQHRNVVQVFELGRNGAGDLFMAMELVEGTDLRRLLAGAVRRGLRVPPWFLVHVMCEVLEGLAYAHDLTDAKGVSRNVVHRDVSPSNIFLSHRGETKLGDFGVAHDEGRAWHTRAGQLRGKVAYMAPEQLRALPVDRRTDLFTVAVVLWEGLAQRRLFGGGAEIDVMQRVLHSSRPRVSEHVDDVPAELDEVLQRALALDPADRFPTARAMQDELLALLPTLGVRRVRSESVCAVLDAVAGRTPPDHAKMGSLHERRPASDAPIPLPLDALTPVVDEPDDDIEALVNEAVADVRNMAEARLECVPHDSILAGLDVRRHASRLSDLASKKWATYGLSEIDYRGPHPFWLRDEAGTTIGPCAYEDVVRIVRSELRQRLSETSQISVGEDRWWSLAHFAERTGMDALLRTQEPRGGQLRAESLTAAFGALARRHATGRLAVVERTAGQRELCAVEVVNGRPTHVDATHDRLQLTELMVAKAIVPAPLVGRMVHEALSTDQSLEHVVATYVGADLDAYRPAFMKERLVDAFANGAVAFFFDERAPRHTKPFARSLLALLPDVVHRIDPRVLERALDLDAELLPSEGFEEHVAQMGLTKAQRMSAALLANGRTLGTLLRQWPEDRALHLTMAYVLEQTELLRPGLPKIA